MHREAGLATAPQAQDEFSGKKGDRNSREMGFAERAEDDRNPADVAAEAYANRAYPGSDIPFTATLGAQQAFNAVKKAGVGNGKHTPGQWTLIGPSTANFPGVLTFSGADYTTSGRITALAIAPGCGSKQCRLWVGAAGGGVWRTDNALSGSGANWTFVSGSFATNAIGTLNYDAASGALYAGTGEPNASGDSEAGMGLYKSTDGGDTWTHLASVITAVTSSSCAASNASGVCTSFSANGTYTGDAFAGRSISSIAVDPTDPNVLWVGSARGVRGISEVSGGASSNPTPPRPPFGLFKSTDGGATFSFVWDGNVSVRGVNHVELDQSDHTRVYAAAFQQGIWRSTGGGAFEQVFRANSIAINVDRAEFALTTKDAHTRIYVGDGEQNSVHPSTFWRVDNADVPAANLTSGGVNIGWKLLTSNSTADPYYATYNYCTGQCWYDNYVVTPAGYPDLVYLGGSYTYGELDGLSNTRAVLLSTDAGEHFTDMTWDASSDTTPNGLHPDQHALVLNPSNPYQFFEGSDGGLMRSSGSFKDVSYLCGARGVSGDDLIACTQLLGRVPSHLYSLNKGLSTLQFQSVSANPTNVKNLIGGTQDNGTWQTTGSFVTWLQTIYGDGGNGGFDVTGGAMVNTFTGQLHDANFAGGDPTQWVFISAPIYTSPESALFYPPIITDPVVSGSIFEGSLSVWRTQDFGGDPATLLANCGELTATSIAGCGDFVKIGPSGANATRLTISAADYRGATRSGGNVAALARAHSDNGTLWAATSAGRVFISKNADAATPTAVTFTRLDTLPSATASPGRFVTRIFVDPADANHAYISYDGYNFNTPSQPGHVFDVHYNPATPDATWTSVDYNIADLPQTSVAYDDVTGDLYLASDFGVMRLPSGTTSWVMAGTGLPMVEVASLTIVPSARILYAATHGRSAWSLALQ
jgi:hypothetical protein